MYAGLSWYKPSCKTCSCLRDKNATPEASKTAKDSTSSSTSVQGSLAPTNKAKQGNDDDDQCDTDCEWDGGAEDAQQTETKSKAAHMLPSTATNALDLDKKSETQSFDNDDFEDGLSSDEYLTMLNALEDEVSLV